MDMPLPQWLAFCLLTGQPDARHLSPAEANRLPRVIDEAFTHCIKERCERRSETPGAAVLTLKAHVGTWKDVAERKGTLTIWPLVTLLRTAEYIGGPM